MNINSFIIYRIFANLVAFWVAGKTIPGFATGDMLSLISASIVLTFLHIFIRPLMVILTLPLQVFSLGLAYIIFNAVYVKITSVIVKDIVAEGFLPALGAAVMISLVNMVLDGLARRQRISRNGSENGQGRY
ncbi:phage holin family protein [Geovibrio ferrireducens]|uniref:phage holin family protein n=1 Tax=Geovibrio ferrireducens TaxID=46201 RepID=UPI002246E57E|nr:phage holin family protein [Geovibrio ferrireducens]